MAARPVDMVEAVRAAHNSDKRTGAERPVALLISKQRIVGPTNGSSAYVLSLARTVREAGYDVWLIQPSADVAGRTPVLRFSEEMSVFARHEIMGMERVGDFAISLSPRVWWGFATGAAKLAARKLLGDRSFLKDNPRPYSIALPWKLQELLFVEQMAGQAGSRLKLAIADYIFGTNAFERLPDDLPKAVIMHDLFCRREGDGADSVAIVDEASEVAMLSRADWIIAIQKEEQDFVREACPNSTAILAAMPAQTVDEPQPGRDNRLLFIGSDTAPNSVGLNWFCEEVWPLVQGVDPQARLDVAGTVGRKFDTATYSNVRFLGLVDDLDAHYRNAGVLISPLTFGSGLKIKLVEAMGQGKAIVATPTTLQGVEEICEPAVISTDDPEVMADAILRLVEDRSARKELASKALACAREHFSARTVHAELRQKLEVLRR